MNCWNILLGMQSFVVIYLHGILRCRQSQILNPGRPILSLGLVYRFLSLPLHDLVNKLTGRAPRHDHPHPFTESTSTTSSSNITGHCRANSRLSRWAFVLQIYPCINMPICPVRPFHVEEWGLIVLNLQHLPMILIISSIWIIILDQINCIPCQ